MKQNANKTSIILKLIDSPFTKNDAALDGVNFDDIYKNAIKNRIRLLCLNSLAKYNHISGLENRREELLKRYLKIQQAFLKVTKILESYDIKYAFFKSIRPYQEVTVDIDILTFQFQYQRTLRTLGKIGYVKLGDGPLSTTFRDIDAKINLDIYDDVGVSHLIYMDKNKLLNSIQKFNISNSCMARSLSIEADLLAVIAHSIVKEHMYVLSEYYTTLFYLKNFTNEKVQSFVSLTENCKLTSVVRTHLSITSLLHYSVHGFVPKKLDSILAMLGRKDVFEVSNVIKNKLKMPHKYHPVTMARAFFELFKDSKTKRSVAAQFSEMLNPKFASSFLDMAIEHVLRETY